MVNRNMYTKTKSVSMYNPFLLKIKIPLLILAMFFITRHVYITNKLSEQRELNYTRPVPRLVVTHSWPIASTDIRNTTVVPKNVSWAFATVLTAGRLKAQESQGVDRDYVSMVCILGNQLARHHPGIERILVVQHGSVSGADLNTIRKSGWVVLRRPHILPMFFKTHGIFQDTWRTWRMGMYKDQFLKLHLWKETQFNRIVFIDADTMLMRHVDFTAVIRSNKFVSCPTKWTKMRMDGRAHSFNGAFFVLTPSVFLYERMIENNVVPEHFKLTGRSGGVDFDLNEMGTLNHFFPDWIIPPEEFHGICSGAWLCCTGVECKCPTSEPPIRYTDTIGLVHGAKSSNHLLNFAPGGTNPWKSARDCLAPLALAREMEYKAFISGNRGRETQIHTP
jgi:hypothetical protein